ncbi:hypothetical protein [Desulfosporosinus sp. OT]|uniref:hypothetical protein n=1 Tax=Desulfosporosinus sp. OT TaxID=913865 RepID=UPI000223B19E|nr:hypothetical protein [Desulfosporosinus sp. OT]EGW41641.1 hypothetical protein DOT_0409 [Desulfosporosinus sp. OT]
MISLFSKYSYRWFALLIALIIVFGSVLLTNFKTSTNSPYSSQETIVKSSNFKQDVAKDIANSFNLSLEDLNKVDEKQLYDQQEEPYASSLLNVLNQVREDQDYGSIAPSIYLKQDGKSGYITAKMGDGTNYLYTIAYNQGWAIVKTDSVQGKAIALNNPGGSNKTYSSLSEAQLQKYLKENSISPLAVQNIGKYTVVLYKTAREELSDPEKTLVPESILKLTKAIELSSDQDGNIINTGGGSGDDNSDIVPVSIAYHNHESEQGYIGFSTVIINNFDILKNAYSVKCCYENNITTTTLVDNHNAFIIPLQLKKVKLINVIISDKDGKVLFDNNEWSKKHGFE